MFDVLLYNWIMDELTNTGGHATVRTPYYSVDLTKPDLGPYTVSARDLNHAVDTVIPIIKQDHPGIDLQKEYNSLPSAIWPTTL